MSFFTVKNKDLGKCSWNLFRSSGPRQSSLPPEILLSTCKRGNVAMSESLTKEQRKKLKKKAAQKRRKSDNARQKEARKSMLYYISSTYALMCHFALIYSFCPQKTWVKN